MERFSGRPAFAVETHPVMNQEGVIAASVSGRVDYGSAAQLRRQLMKILSAGPGRGLVLELSGVERLDTAAAAVLVEVLMAGQQRDLQVLLCGSSPMVQRLFQLSGLDDALECCCESPAETKRRLTEAAPR
jgi:anti-anti-sigma factor